jgi:hypothetical protein
MNKVTFVETEIHVNGLPVGHMSSGREVWIELKVDGKYEFAGRFKYMKARTKAKRYIKWLLERFTPEQIIEGLKADSPMGFAESKGYDPLTKKERIQWDAYMAKVNAKLPAAVVA